MNYRPEIDGLRAVAVIVVVLFHAKIELFGGGYVGVDVFFVISGYLITTIILSDIEAKKFSIVEFYERRARRILPALFFVMICCVPFAVIMMQQSQLVDFFRSTGAVTLFVSNFLFWRESDYFAPTAEESPLLHTWSLSVEEQFYVLFPIMMIFLVPFGRRWVLMVLVCGATASLTLSEWLSVHSPVANFYFSFTRAWELAVGALIAIAPHGRRFSAPSLNQLASFFGLVAIVISVVVFTDATPFPGIATLLPVVGTALIIIFAHKNTVVGKLLSNRAMVGIGLVSYSAYLWHWPLFAFARIQSTEEPTETLFVVLGVVSFGLAYMSWRYIEAPFRNKSRFSRKAIFAWSGLGSALFITLALSAQLGVVDDLWLRALSEKQLERWRTLDIATTSGYESMRNEGCHIWNNEFTPAFEASFSECASEHGPALFVTGGSHGMDLYNAISQSTSHPFVASISQGYCRAHTYLNGRPPFRCHYEDLEDFLVKHRSSISALVYTQTADRLFPASMQQASISDISLKSVDEVISYLVRVGETSGVNVVLMGPLPLITKEIRKIDPRMSFESQLPSFRLLEPSLLEEVDELLALRAKAARLNYVSKIKVMNFEMPRDLIVDGEFTYSDSRHLSTAGERLYGPMYIRELSRVGVTLTSPVE